MSNIVIKSMEDIFNLPKDIESVEVAQSVIMQYFLSDNPNEQINMTELKEIFSRSIRLSYSQRDYLGNIVINKEALSKLSLPCSN